MALYENFNITSRISQDSGSQYLYEENSIDRRMIEKVKYLNQLVELISWDNEIPGNVKIATDKWINELHNMSADVPEHIITQEDLIHTLNRPWCLGVKFVLIRTYVYMSGIHHDIHSEVEKLVFSRDDSDVKIYEIIQAANSLLDRENSEIGSFHYMGVIDNHIHVLFMFTQT